MTSVEAALPAPAARAAAPPENPPVPAIFRVVAVITFIYLLLPAVIQFGIGSLIQPRTDVHISGTTPLSPIALGRTTNGWIVFEVPLVTPVTSLIVAAPDEQAFEAITIALAGA